MVVGGEVGGNGSGYAVEAGEEEARVEEDWTACLGEYYWEGGEGVGAAGWRGRW